MKLSFQDLKAKYHTVSRNTKVFLLIGLLAVGAAVFTLPRIGLADDHFRHGRPFGGHFGGPIPMHKVMASLNADPKTVLEDLKAGKSLQAIAEAHGGDLAQLKTTAAEAVAKAIDRAVAKGELTAQQAEGLKSTLPERLDKALAKPGLFNFAEKKAALEQAAADTLKLSVEDMYKALKEKKSLQAVAEAQGVDPASVTAAVKSRFNAYVDEAVNDGILPGDIGETIKTKFAERLDKMAQANHFGKFAAGKKHPSKKSSDQ